MPAISRPTRQQLAAARGGRVPDLIAPGLRLLFVGINPSLYSAAVGHHFARPGNRFWPALHAAGFTERLLAPFEEQILLEQGYGITNLVDGATARADELSPAELLAGAARLLRKIRRYRPGWVAFLGISAYRTAFGRKDGQPGQQADKLADAHVWILPSPSGLNAHYQLPELARVFTSLRRALEVRLE